MVEPAPNDADPVTEQAVNELVPGPRRSERLKRNLRKRKKKAV